MAFNNDTVAERLVLKYDDPSKVTRLQDCPKDVIDKVKLTFDALKISKINIKMNDFMTFWGRIEKKFDCNGWCESSYTGEDGKYHIMTKYLFSDVNKGVVRNRGCMHRLIDWLPRSLTHLVPFSLSLG